MKPCADGPGAPQPADERLAVHAPPGCGCDPARPSELRQRPAQGHADGPAGDHAAVAGRIHDAVSRPARPHAAQGAGEQGVHVPRGQRPGGAHPFHPGVPARRHRRPRQLRPHGGGRPAPAGDRRCRDAGRAAGRPGSIQDLVGAARACWSPRSAPANARSRKSPQADSMRISARSSRPGGRSRGTTSSAPSCRRRTKAIA